MKHLNQYILESKKNMINIKFILMENLIRHLQRILENGNHLLKLNKDGIVVVQYSKLLK